MTESTEIRTYGGWRRSRGIGVGQLDTRQTLSLLVLVGAVTMSVAIGGLGFGVPVLGAAAVAMALLVWRRDGILLLDYVADAARYRRAASRGETSLRGQVMARWPRAGTLPGVLATTEVLDVEIPGHPRCGLIWDRRSGLLSATSLLGTGGTLLTDSADAERYVSSWGALLGSLADQPAIRWATVTVDLTPGAVGELQRDHAQRLDPGAPPFATDVLRSLAASAPAASARVETRMTLTVDVGAGWGKARDLTEGAAQALRLLSVVNTSAAGAEVIRRATAADLIRMVRTAYDPSARDVPHEEWAEEGLGWPDAGPIGAEELPGEYRHEGAVSVTWALQEAPRQRVAHSVLLRLLSPGRYPRRVTLAYRVLDREEASSLLERELTAADVRAAYRHRTNRDESARERRDRQLSSSQAEEEASGAGLVQFSLYVTTTVTDPDDLPRARAEVEAAAAGSRLKLRVCRFGQSAAFAAGLPCGVYPPHAKGRR
jgi:hypothetical protein